MDMDGVERAIVLCTLFSGIFFNFVVFIYFCKRFSFALSRVLMFLLNFSDLMFTLTGTISYLYNQRDPNLLYFVSFFAYFESILVSAVLSATRAVIVTRPFCTIRNSLVYGGVAVLTLCVTMVTLIAWLSKSSLNDDSASIVTVGTIIIVITFIVTVISTAIITRTLLTSEIDDNVAVQLRNRRVTVTILTISVLFITINGIALIFVFIQRYGHYVIGRFGRTVFFPVHSALNPLVFILRNYRDIWRCVATCYHDLLYTRNIIFYLLSTTLLNI